MSTAKRNTQIGASVHQASALNLSKASLKRAVDQVHALAAAGDKRAQKLIRASEEFRKKLERETQLTQQELDRVLR